MSSVTAEELWLILVPQRRKANQRARMYGSLGVLLTGVWIWKVLTQPVEYASLLYVVAWFMMILTLAVLTFVELWRNWNLRTGRLAPFIEFFRTRDTWIPS